MSKRKTSLVKVYLVTVFITLVLVGGTAIFVYTQFLSDKPKASSETSSVQSGIMPFVPEVEQNQTVLYILDCGDTETDDIFLLTRFLPVEQKLILVPISGNTFSQINTKKSTVYDFYRTGGSLSAVEAVENATNIDIEKYMKFNKDSFNTLVDIFGGVNFTVPYDLIYDNTKTNESVVLRSGRQSLDGIRLRWLLTFPEYKEGEEYRNKMTGSAISSMINQSLGERLDGTLDLSFNSIINSVDTNITAYDFNFRKDAISYLIEAGNTPAQFKTPVGKLNEEKQLVLDTKFKEDLLYWFEVDPIVET